MAIPTAHNNAKKEDIAKTVLMPGDPLRAKFIAENFLTNARLVNNVRGVQGHTGTWKGVPVTVMASGMGIPAISIYSWELFNFYDVDNIIRIGSAGALSDELKLMDIIAGQGACTNSNYGQQFNLGGTFAPIADYTLLSASVDDEVVVAEMGMNHAGEIDYLADIARPDVALITNIGDCHIEYLGSREGIFRAKCEVFGHMDDKGVAILNGDDELLATLRGALPMETVFTGMGSGLDYTARDIETDGEGRMSCTIQTPRAAFRAHIPALGRHMVYPALMAAAVGERYGMTGEEIARGIANFLPTKMRMNVLRLPGDVTVLNDAYNANPQSMRAAATVLRDVPGARKVAVVGDMMELGDNSQQFHYAVGECFGELGADCVIAVGQLAAAIAEGAREGGVARVLHFESLEEAMGTICGCLAPGTVILVKASRAMHFEKIVIALADAANRA